MIKVEKLSQSFGRKQVLKSVDLHIDRREICALVGRNGAGKSTFIQSLVGLLPVKQGSITINGAFVSHKTHHWKKVISYLPEKFMLYPHLTGLENLTFFAETISKIADTERMKQVLMSVRLWDDRNMQVKHYSKGMLQRLGLAITLYQNSDILILDEPTSGIDPMGRKEILEVLKSLQNKTILLSSHHIDEIKQICTHVAYLNDGKIKKYKVREFLDKYCLGGIEV
ncbi:ABC transporter ATP-binding protein [Neobacillus thermocopriae]|uniref:ABC transporter ATP-binding protein n=1 Tax=Neobacillus thermocopriae TaxID=1215031 RepID=A0A6B3TRH7_9BACI|nr:ABC transporter ATP-binding protein [Neobacillus thermocopriae]MED3624982.1 ABC transporter ATP-binding protein [Neobacillus thermocopriae]MED3713252.1 ABC transporter ATP-binding protein [Neobacillus thermocopriae]NEX78307.1 ABC transporter ATP-binding protein [Neobacillus thermocopriae]